MNRTLSTLFAGLLIAALSPVALGAPPASSAALATAGTVRPPVPPADLAARLSNGLALRVAVDNNHAAAAGVPCADLGADGAACATGRLILQNRGTRRSPMAAGSSTCTASAACCESTAPASRCGGSPATCTN